MLRKIVFSLGIGLVSLVWNSFAVNCNINMLDKNAYSQYDWDYCVSQLLNQNKDIYRKYRSEVLPYWIWEVNYSGVYKLKDYSDREIKIVWRIVQKFWNRILDKVQNLPPEKRIETLEKINNRLLGIMTKIRDKYYPSHLHKFGLYVYVIYWLKDTFQKYIDYDKNYDKREIKYCNEIYHLIPDNIHINITNPDNNLSQKQLNDFKNKLVNSLCAMELKWVPKDIINKFLEYKYIVRKGDQKSKYLWLAWLRIQIKNGVDVTIIPTSDVEIWYLNKNDFIRETIFHELSHKIEIYLWKQNDRLNHLNQFLSKAWDYNFDSNHITIQNYRLYLWETKIKRKDDKCFVSSYAKTNTVEDFAEFGRFYFSWKLKELEKNNKCLQEREKIFKQILSDLK